LPPCATSFADAAASQGLNLLANALRTDVVRAQARAPPALSVRFVRWKPLRGKCEGLGTHVQTPHAACA
jgi:hypothetical protein